MIDENWLVLVIFLIYDFLFIFLPLRRNISPRGEELLNFLSSD